MQQQEQLVHLLEGQNGTVPVIVYCKAERAYTKLERNLWIVQNDEKLRELVQIFGESNIAIKEKDIEKY